MTGALALVEAITTRNTSEAMNVHSLQELHSISTAAR
jgi:hypothetical protein